ncbi:helix-turn-helix domain-containing protein [bacterium 210820-DFI.6.37]|nr:helix-turn-helix domain-containing protein [bacterium 210820-DFI.6.37]
MERATFSERLNSIIKEKKIRQVDLCRKTGIGKSAMSQYLRGSFEPKQQKLYALAAALDVSEAWLMGYDVPKERRKPAFSEASDSLSASHSQTRELSFDSFYFNVPDDSMEGVHIPKGSVALVKRSSVFTSGQVVHCWLENQLETLRTFHEKGDTIMLLAASAGCEPVICSRADLANGLLKIDGVVTQVTIRL